MITGEFDSKVFSRIIDGDALGGNCRRLPRDRKGKLEWCDPIASADYWKCIA